MEQVGRFEVVKCVEDDDDVETANRNGMYIMHNVLRSSDTRRMEKMEKLMVNVLRLSVDVFV